MSVQGTSQEGGEHFEVDHLIEELKADWRAKRSTRLPHNCKTLTKIYERLLARHRAYATDELIVEEIIHLLDEECRTEDEANMMIVDLFKSKPPHFSEHQTMASAIAEILLQKGECSVRDLMERGFAPEDIQQKWSTAYALALIEAEWMDDEFAQAV